MKFCLLLSVLPAAAFGFAPSASSVVQKTSSLNMVSFSTPPPDATPDPERRVSIPQSYEEYREGGLFKKGDVMIDPDWKFPKYVVAMGPAMLMMYPNVVGVAAAVFHLVLGAFLWSQTNRVRVVFSKDSFEIFNLSNDGHELKEKPSNYVAGTVNRWNYKDIVDYGFYPSVDYPFIVYFKETATAQEQWGNFGWWGQFAGATFDPTGEKMSLSPSSSYTKVVEGQPHFMPGLFNVEEFVEQMEKHNVKRKGGLTLKGRGFDV